MSKALRRACIWLAGLVSVIAVAASGQSPSSQVGREVAIPIHLQDGEEFTIPTVQLIEFGARLFSAKFTVQEGAGRPKSKGTGAPISDPSAPLVFPRNFDRISSPDANACSGCHNVPTPGAGGDRKHIGQASRHSALAIIVRAPGSHFPVGPDSQAVITTGDNGDGIG